MILQALNGYYHRLSDEGGADIASEGFQKKRIPFLIVLNRKGEFVGLQDTRTPLGKKLVAREFIVPKEHERSGKNAWQTANLLWDHFGYVLAYPKTDSEANKEMAVKQHSAFVANVKKLIEAYPGDGEIEAVHRFLSDGNFDAVYSHPFWQECKKIPGCNLSFCVDFDSEIRLVFNNKNVRSYVIGESAVESDDETENEGLKEIDGICLITGEHAPIARLHPRTPIPGSKSNAKIVSFQKGMGFDSYGMQQSYNAPTSKSAAFAYTTALNTLLAQGSRQRIQVGDASTVFWAEKENKMEELFADFFGEPPKGQSEQDNATIRALYESPRTGAVPLLDDKTRFYVLGLAPNAARIAIRFWYQGSVGEVSGNIKQHFDDISIVHAEYQMSHCPLNELLAATALETKDPKKTNRVYFRGKYYDVTPNLAGDFMKAILAGTPYPETLLSAAITRLRAEQAKNDQNGKSIQNVTYPRAALIKAILTRRGRVRYYKQQEKEIGMSLDTSNTNPGYLLGRLFAVLEKVQIESAGGEGKINATIRDRFYGAASSTPVAVFAHLMKLKNHHLAKLENYKGYYEKLIGEISDKISAANAFPAHLPLDDQGRFAVGYYHQRQDFFTKKDKTTTMEDHNNE